MVESVKALSPTTSSSIPISVYRCSTVVLDVSSNLTSSVVLNIMRL